MASLVGMILTGQSAYNQELLAHGQAGLGIPAYLASGNFLSALLENWESEFLQMAVYVILTAMLFQRGSAESRDPDQPDRDNDAVWWRHRHPAAAWLYERSLGIFLAVLFLVSFVLHWWFSFLANNEDAIRHGKPTEQLMRYLLDSKLWFESFQNWQSEFLSTALLVVLSIFLRHKGSPESKPVAAPNSHTGD